MKAVLSRMVLCGRVALCGLISGYTGDTNPGDDFSVIIVKRLTVRGFLVFDYKKTKQAVHAPSHTSRTRLRSICSVYANAPTDGRHRRHDTASGETEQDRRGSSFIFWLCFWRKLCIRQKYSD